MTRPGCAGNSSLRSYWHSTAASLGKRAEKRTIYRSETGAFTRKLLPTQGLTSSDAHACSPGRSQIVGYFGILPLVDSAFDALLTGATAESVSQLSNIPVLLGESFAGVVTCDRAKMYWQAPRLQRCWAHLKRDFQALVDGGREP
jgi:hypothetical protein